MGGLIVLVIAEFLIGFAYIEYTEKGDRKWKSG
jgi:hypothetical protein